MVGLGALSFSAPLILSTLALMPAVYFLLRITPPAPSRKRFPAFSILRSLSDDDTTARRTPPWLLLLRLVILGLLITGLAGPILNAPTQSASNRPILLVIDDSWAAAAGWRARQNAFSALLEEARQSGRTLRLLSTAPRPDSQALSPVTPTTAVEATAALTALVPSALTPDYNAAMDRLADIPDDQGPFDIYWLSDGLQHENAEDFAGALKQRGTLTALIDAATPILFLPRSQEPNAYAVTRVSGEGEAWTGRLVAYARDGRTAAQEPVTLAPGETSASVTLSIPVALRNEIARVALDGVRSAGAVRLADGRERRAHVGLTARSADAAGDSAGGLLSGGFFVRKALQPSADFLSGDIASLARSDAGVIILDDIGRLRADDADALETWMNEGGVLIRFAGSVLAEAVIDGPLRLSPVSLRGGGRAFGGALSWETPQPLGGFAEGSPFADLMPASDVFVRRQVLATPGGETSAKTWASLTDGTPLVTGERRGAGALVLFHVTATPAWSDLPLSQTFVDMLMRLAALSAVAGETAQTDDGDTNGAPVYAAIGLLDGFGALRPSSAAFRGVSLAEIDAGADATSPPGFYGAPSAPLAVNVVDNADAVQPFAVEGIARAPYADVPPRRLGGYFFIAALLLFAGDALFSFRAAGGRLNPMPVAGLALFISIATPISQADAQPLDATLSEKQIEAGLMTRFAHVTTGDAEIDRITAAGLAALSNELARRTAVEPAPPHAVNLETDDLTVYPLLYWPIPAETQTPSDAALANIELFMRFGGLVIFDTRDEERAIGDLVTPERAALRAILQNIDTPPLHPLPDDHVLKRSFYLLPDLPGRETAGPIWVQAAGEANDAVTPLIIGGRDWAGAWARDAIGRDLLPMPRGGPRAREFSYRAGINMAMVALTGNYKSDQVHTPVLLERLGR
ncbi:MAG: DUF4159 domain-containing protein [Pseudomonadota bacterium]